MIIMYDISSLEASKPTWQERNLSRNLKKGYFSHSWSRAIRFVDMVNNTEPRLLSTVDPCGSVVESSSRRIKLMNSNQIFLKEKRQDVQRKPTKSKGTKAKETGSEATCMA